MNRIITKLLIVLLIAVPTVASGFDEREQCTSILLSPAAGAEGVPVLWKNRDTNTLSNRVVFVNETPFDYLALVDADDPSGRRCFAGLNSAGFAIMNTVAYNLPEKAGEAKDEEGTIMADALRTCRTVDDFRAYLASNTGPHLGSLANFGVMDADGRTLLFEVHNHGFTVIDAAEQPSGYLVNTNFARSGAGEEGAGYLRFKRASQLVEAIDDQPIPFETILTRFSRDIGHVLLSHPTLDQIRTDGRRQQWISTKDCINKAYTAACVVMVGARGGPNPRPATMWVIPGEPLTTAAIPLWVQAGAVPDVFWKGEPDAPLWGASLRIKKTLRPLNGGNQADYLRLTPLFREDGTGIRDIMDPVETEILAATRTFMQQTRTPSEYRVFQARMAGRVMDAMEKILLVDHKEK